MFGSFLFAFTLIYHSTFRMNLKIVRMRSISLITFIWSNS